MLLDQLVPPQHGVQGPQRQHPSQMPSGLCLDMVGDGQGVGPGGPLA